VAKKSELPQTRGSAKTCPSRRTDPAHAGEAEVMAEDGPTPARELSPWYVDQFPSTPVPVASAMEVAADDVQLADEGPDE